MNPEKAAADLREGLVEAGFRMSLAAVERIAEVRVRFNHRGRTRACVIPPTYDSSIDAGVLKAVRSSLAGTGADGGLRTLHRVP